MPSKRRRADGPSEYTFSSDRSPTRTSRYPASKSLRRRAVAVSRRTSRKKSSTRSCVRAARKRASALSNASSRRVSATCTVPRRWSLARRLVVTGWSPLEKWIPDRQSALRTGSPASGPLAHRATAERPALVNGPAWRSALVDPEHGYDMPARAAQRLRKRASHPAESARHTPDRLRAQPDGFETPRRKPTKLGA